MYKTITNYPNYSINEDGVIKNNKTNKILKQTIKKSRNNGYYVVYLYNEEGRRMFFVHRLVASTFIDNPNNYPQVNHKDENTVNNKASNLEWCTCEYNNKYGTKAQRLSEKFKGEHNPFFGIKHTEDSKRKMSQAKQGKPSNNRRKVIVDDYKIYNSLTECSKALEISLTQVFNIIHGKRKSTFKIEYYKEVM